MISRNDKGAGFVAFRHDKPRALRHFVGCQIEEGNPTARFALHVLLAGHLLFQFLVQDQPLLLGVRDALLQLCVLGDDVGRAVFSRVEVGVGQKREDLFPSLAAN